MIKNNCLLCFILIIAFVSSQAFCLEFGDISVDSKVDIHGYVSQGYMKSTHNNFFGETEEGTADFGEIAINLGTDITSELHIGVQILSRKLGEFGKGKVEIDWGYADYRWKDWLGLRIGKMKMVHGLYNTTRDIDFLRTSIFLPQSVYNEAWRDTVSSAQGGEIYGDIYIGSAGSLAYQFQLGASEYPVDSGVATTTSDQSRLMGIDYNPDKYNSKYGATAGLFWSTPIEGLKLGFTGWITTFELEGDASHIKTGQSFGKILVDARSAEYTGSIEYSLGDFLFAAEYSRNDYDFRNSGAGFEAVINFYTGIDPALGKLAMTAKHKEFESEGYYGAMSYRFTDWFEAGFYYSVYYADRDDKKGKNNESGSRKLNGYKDHEAWLKDACLSFRFDINENWIFKIEGHKMDGAAILMKEINFNSYGRLDTQKDWYLGAVKMTFNF